MGGADQFMSVRPWIGQMREPTGWKKPDVYADKKPPVDIELEWIHGYRGSQARNNLSVLLDGNITYFAAGVGVVLDSSTN